MTYASTEGLSIAATRKATPARARPRVVEPVGVSPAEVWAAATTVAEHTATPAQAAAVLDALGITALARTARHERTSTMTEHSNTHPSTGDVDPHADPLGAAIADAQAIPRDPYRTRTRRASRATVQALLDNPTAQVVTTEWDVDSRTGVPAHSHRTESTEAVAVTLAGLGWTQAEWDDPTVTD